MNWEQSYKADWVDTYVESDCGFQLLSLLTQGFKDKDE